MASIKDLIQEKKRYNLELKISNKEKELLKLNYPIQKIIGYIEMQEVKIYINKFVLIPRYETEELIIKAKELIKFNDKDTKILDLCTGSGFIALAIKKSFPNFQVVASDISYESIMQTKINAKINKLKINIIQSNLFENINEKFDIIISNPPYLSSNTILDNSVKFYEPENALIANEKGFAIIKKIIFQTPKFLNKNGVLLLEIDEDKMQFIDQMKNIKVKYFRDINNKIRIAKIKFDQLF